MGKVRPGDGSRLKPFRTWDSLWRGLYSITIGTSEYAVDVDYFWFTPQLYKDGVQVAKGSYPVRFDVAGGHIDVDYSLFGIKRMHYVHEGGEEILVPHRNSAEGLRGRFDKRYPLISRIVGILTIIILLASLVVLVPQVIERITHISFLPIEPWDSPLDLPSWANTAMTVGGVLAAIERALSMRNHWLIDADTWWFD